MAFVYLRYFSVPPPPSRGYLKCPGTFLIAHLWIFYWHLVGRGQSTAMHPTVHTSSPHNKELSSLNVSGV